MNRPLPARADLRWRGPPRIAALPTSNQATITRFFQQDPSTFDPIKTILTHAQPNHCEHIEQYPSDGIALVCSTSPPVPPCDSQVLWDIRWRGPPHLAVSHNQTTITRFFQQDPSTAEPIKSILTCDQPNHCEYIDQYPADGIARACSMSPLVHLCDYQELWEIICSHLSGDSISLVALDKVLGCATRRSCAFVLLCGRDNDGVLCPWHDSYNVLRQPFTGWTDRHFRLRQVSMSDCDRLAQLGDLIVAFLKHKCILMNPHYRDQPPHARPSSPIGSAARGLLLLPDYSPPQSPPCFPEHLHQKEKHRRRLYEDCMATGNFSDSDNPSSWTSNTSSEDGWITDND